MPSSEELAQAAQEQWSNCIAPQLFQQISEIVEERLASFEERQVRYAKLLELWKTN
jgi:hypothetical protein